MANFRFTRTVEDPTAIIDNDLNQGAAGVQTGQVNAAGSNQVDFLVEYTHHSDATSLKFTVETKSVHRPTKFYAYVEEDSDPPAVNIAVLTPRTYTVSDFSSLVNATTYYFQLSVPVVTADEIRLTVTPGAKSADATIAVYTIRTVQ